jgi:capsular polysaccharide biosynthesis protein/Mrp family chromosome partitioning ATPase
VEFGTYVVIFRRWWWSIALATITAGLCGYLVAGTIPRVYESNVRLLVGPVNANVEILRGSALLIPTYAELVTSDEVLEEAASRLNLDVPAAGLRPAVEATANDITRVLAIRVTGDEPERAALLAGTLAASLIELAQRGTGSSGTELEGSLSVIEPAAVNPIPIAPDVSLLVMLAAIAGLVGALVIVLFLEYISDTVKDATELLSNGAVFLGSVSMPTVSPRSPQPLIVDAHPESRAATTIRLLVTKVTYSYRAEPLQSLLVIGTEHGIGSGEVAANFAAVLARSGRRVALVDANDDVPQMTRMLSHEGRPGVGELLEEPIPRERADEILDLTILRRPPGMDFLPAGSSLSRLVHMERARDFMAILKARSDIVVVNAAAIHRSASALVWAQAVDAVLVLAHSHRTKRENLEHTIKSLALVGARLAGVAFVEHRGLWLGWSPSRAFRRKASTRAGGASGRGGLSRFLKSPRGAPSHVGGAPSRIPVLQPPGPQRDHEDSRASTDG